MSHGDLPAPKTRDVSVTPRTVLIVCAKAPRRMPVPAVREGGTRWRVKDGENHVWWEPEEWRCSYCGARVKVVA